jgi:hypothetical protein
MSFGVDFNPAADRLRIISDAGQNLAHNVNAGGVYASGLSMFSDDLRSIDALPARSWA